MKRLTQEQLAAVNKVRDEIRSLNGFIDAIYQNMTMSLGIEDSDFLFDYVYNCDGSNDAYEQFVLGKLYGSNK